MMTGVKDYTELAEYQEKLATSSLNWSFLGENAEDAPAEQDEGPDAEPVGQRSAQIAQTEDPCTHGGVVTSLEGDPTAQGGEPTIQGGEPTGEVVVIIPNETRGGEEA
ncbi:unnamed protein product [Prunus armeniaca]|uniref:Uncharacterized protein n=1 Tax=Prunus armeniaca TaxID=36596 RepID=A0A6J5X8N8_PRUAR|nr:unnamed protein product [Prunus armeniaca]